MLCTVTAIAGDGQRSTIEVEVDLCNYATIAYNHRTATDHKLIRPDRDTTFEITPAGGKAMRVTWSDVLAWANAKAARSNARR